MVGRRFPDHLHRAAKIDVSTRAHPTTTGHVDRHGTATLPLHSGSASRWLFDRVVDLGGAIAEAVVEGYGRSELLRRLADPYWFQALGRPRVRLALPRRHDHHDGRAEGGARPGRARRRGRRRQGRDLPAELRALPFRSSSGGRRLADHSRTSATVDDAAVQDGYALYHHTVVVTEDGEWCVVRQGMGAETARRYH